MSGATWTPLHHTGLSAHLCPVLAPEEREWGPGRDPEDWGAWETTDEGPPLKCSRGQWGHRGGAGRCLGRLRGKTWAEARMAVASAGRGRLDTPSGQPPAGRGQGRERLGRAGGGDELAEALARGPPVRTMAAVPPSAREAASALRGHCAWPRTWSLGKQGSAPEVWACPASALLEHSWWCCGPVEQAGAPWPARQGEALTPRAAGRACVTSAPLPQTCWPWPRVPGGRAWQRPQDTLRHLATAWWSSSLNQGWSGLLTPPTPKRVLGVGSRWGPGGAHGGCSGAGAAAGVGVAVGKVRPQGSAPLVLIRGHLRLAG